MTTRSQYAKPTEEGPPGRRSICLMHRAAMLEFEGKSYRLKEAASRLALSGTQGS